MHTKIINAKTSNNTAVYTNKGSSSRAVNYVGKEEKENEKVFFSADKDASFDKKEVTQAIDNNIKGIKEQDEKFDSIIISPSEAELKHIGNDPEKLKEYTRKVMQNYAENFDLTQKEKSPGKAVEFLESGPAPYNNIKENKASYYVKFKTDKGEEKTIWGVNLAPAVEASRVVPGEKVFIQQTGEEAVKDEKGTKRSRNNWEIVTTEEMQQRQEIKAAELAANPPPKLPAPEPVWFATVHHAREFDAADVDLSKRVNVLKEQGLSLKEILDLKKTDELLVTYKATQANIEKYYKIGEVKAGDLKTGDQRHIHLIVSRRDKEMKVTLNPNTYNRFNKLDFMRQNGESFKEQLNYQGKTDTLDEFREKTMSWKIEHLNKKLNLAPNYLVADKVIEAYRASTDKALFNKRFNQLEYKINNGKLPTDPVAFLVNQKEFSKSIKEEKTESLAENLTQLGKSLSYSMSDSPDYSITQDDKRKVAQKLKRLRQNNNEQSR